MSDNTDTAADPAAEIANPAGITAADLALTAIAGKLVELGHLGDGDDVAEKAVEILQLLTDKVERIELELTAANEAVAAAAEAAKATAKTAKAEKAPKPAKARAVSAKAVKADALDLGDMPAGRERDQALLDAIRAAETVEIAFSDGKSELAAVDPVRVSGDAWRVSIVGVQLGLDELIVHGPATGKAGYPLAGYGLFLDGVLAAYAERGGQLVLGGGSAHNLAPDIVFRA